MKIAACSAAHVEHRNGMAERRSDLLKDKRKAAMMAGVDLQLIIPPILNMDIAISGLKVLFPFSVFGQSTLVGGTLTSNTVWSPAMGTILVYSNVIVTSSATLTIEAGTTVRLTNGISISAQAGCAIDIEGTATAPVLLLPM